MGYVFDAMNRSQGEDRPRPKSFVDDPPMEADNPAVPVEGSTDAGEGNEGTVSPISMAQLNAIDDGEGPLRTADAESQAATDGESSTPALRMANDEPPPDDIDDRMVVVTEPSSIMAEEYRSIRTGLLARWRQKRHVLHTITSATPQEGKTITSLNLGLSFAELRNRRTIVVEADLRLPQFSKLLGLPDDAPGLLNYLAGEKTLSEVTHELRGTGLLVIPAGGRVNNEAVQLLSSNRMANLLKTLRQKYDHVIVDTPPVVELADAGILGAQSDDVLMIVRMQRSPRQLVEQAIRTLESYNAPVAGLIATDQKRHRGRYYYRYRYGYHYGGRYHAKAA